MYKIYAYTDNRLSDRIVYIGYDGSGRRDQQHHYPSRREKSLINSKIAEEPLRYTYQVIAISDHEDIARDIERLLINEYRPTYNVRIKEV